MAAPGSLPTRSAEIPPPPPFLLRAKQASSSPPPVATPAGKPSAPPGGGEAESQGEGWFGRACRSFLALSCASYGLSTIVHLVVLLIFSLVIWHSQGGQSLSMTLGLASGTAEEMLNLQSFEISAGFEGSEEPSVEIKPVPIDLPSPMKPAAHSQAVKRDGNADGTGEDAQQQHGTGTGTEFAMARGGNVVQKGSFAVWTLPDDPLVGEDYAIVIEVTLPEETKKYRRGDLSGQLVGSDSYRIRIPDGTEYNGVGWERPRRQPRFNHKGNKARLVLFVRGSNQARVTDRILIHSRLLNESQKLEVIF